jgi:hypothetical protein
MHLDMLTMTAVNITVTAILGAVLVFTWARERGSPFVGWWGLAQLVLAAGVLIAGGVAHERCRPDPWHAKGVDAPAGAP